MSVASNNFKNRPNWVWDLSIQKVLQLKDNKSVTKKKEGKKEEKDKGSEKVTRQSVGWGLQSCGDLHFCSDGYGNINLEYALHLESVPKPNTF